MGRRVWHLLWRHRSSTESPGTEDLGRECEAFLNGRFDEYLSTAGRPFPAWVWLNRLAHGSLDDVRALAASEPVSAFDTMVVISQIARQLVRKAGANEDSLRALQRQTLVPLESAMATVSPESVPTDLRGLAAAMELALASRPKPLSR